MPSEKVSDSETSLYAEIFRCESCSDCKAPKGVIDFVAVGPRQTVPVSHFGKISQSAVWLILNNPKGDRGDPAVSISPGEFGANSRATLSQDAIVAIKKRLDSYFERSGQSHTFFARWIALLDGIRVDGQGVTFGGGGICAVDLIKCPTAGDWMGYVMTPEGKTVWDKCLRHEPGHRYLLRQIELHRPAVLVFAGTQACVNRPWRGSKNTQLSSLADRIGSTIIENVWTLDHPRRISIGLKSQRFIQTLSSTLLQREQCHLQTLLDSWAL
jgi:hypothetical protein